MSSDFDLNGSVILNHQDFRTVSKTSKSIKAKKSHLLVSIESRIYYPLFAASNCIKIKPFVLLCHNSSLQSLPEVTAKLLLLDLIRDKQRLKKLLSNEFSNEIAFNETITFKCLLGFEFIVPLSDEHSVSSATDYHFYTYVAKQYYVFIIGFNYTHKH